MLSKKRDQMLKSFLAKIHFHLCAKHGVHRGVLSSKIKPCDRCVGSGCKWYSTYIHGRECNQSFDTICPQAIGIEGVKLIESVIWPDSFYDPSKAEDKEDQCVKITTLKGELRRQLEQGEWECHIWKKTKYMVACTTNSLIDILGS